MLEGRGAFPAEKLEQRDPWAPGQRGGGAAPGPSLWEKRWPMGAESLAHPSHSVHLGSESASAGKEPCVSARLWTSVASNVKQGS